MTIMTIDPFVEVLLFAGAREAAGTDRIQLPASLPMFVSELKQSIVRHYPVLKPFIDYGRIAVGNDFVDDSDIIQVSVSKSTVIALIPPVSGG